MLWDKHLRTFRRIPIEKLPAIAMITVLLGRGSVELLRWRGFPGLLTLVLEAFAVLLLTAIFIYGFPSLRRGKASGWRERALEHEEQICLAILSAALLMGTEYLQIWNLSLGNIMGRLLILLLALAGGEGLGRHRWNHSGDSRGLRAGFSPYAVALSAFSGLLAGAFRSHGKGGVVGRFTLSIDYYAADCPLFPVAYCHFGICACNFVIFMYAQASNSHSSRALPGTDERMKLEEKKQERLQNLVTKRLTHLRKFLMSFPVLLGSAVQLVQMRKNQS